MSSESLSPVSGAAKRTIAGSGSVPSTLSTRIFIGHGESRPTPAISSVTRADPAPNSQYGLE
jgi:hypothetical protein